MKPDLNRKKILISLIVAVVVIILDRITKAIAYTKLHYGNPKPFIDSIWQWTLTLNPHSVWGLSLGKHFPYELMVIGLSIIVIALIVFEPKPRFYVLYSMILGGAIGNLIDRIRLGAVIDFIDWGFPHGPRWPIFNLADSAISVGVALLIVFSLVEALKEKKEISKEVEKNDN